MTRENALIEALRRAGCDPKPTRSGWRAKCPAHDDRHPSLSVAERDGKILIHCHRGCRPEEVLHALQLDWRALFEDGANTKRDDPPPRTRQAAQGTVTRYEVRGVDGHLYAIHVREDVPGRGKRMWWELPDGRMGLDSLKVEDLPLYGSELIPSFDREKPVVIVEGEKCALALRHHGFQALGTFGSNCTPSPEVLGVLRGFTVTLWPDNDEPGKLHMIAIARRLRALGIETRLVPIPEGRPRGWDAADAASEDPSLLQALVDQAKNWDIPPERLPGLIISAQELLRRRPRPRRFIIPGLLPQGGVTLLAGPPKIGKSWLALQLALAVAHGGFALGKIKVEAQTPTLFLALEDNEHRLQDRLRFLLNGEQPPENLEFATAWNQLPDGLSPLAQWFSSHSGGLVVVDTLAHMIPPRPTKSDLYLSDYNVIRSLQDLALAHGGTILAIWHTRKQPAPDYLDQVLGTRGISGGADVVWVLQRTRGSRDATLQVTGRDVRDASLALRWDDSSGWIYLGPAEEVALNEGKQAILRHLREHGPATARDLSAALEAPYETVRKWLQRLEKAGWVYKKGYQYVATPRKEEEL